MKRVICRTIDKFVLRLRKLRGIETKEDWELLRSYRIAYVFANGDCLPRIFFRHGYYWMEGLFDNTVKPFTDRQLRRMTRNLIKRVARDVGVSPSFIGYDMDSVYKKYLSQTEQLVADGKVRSMNSLAYRIEGSLLT